MSVQQPIGYNYTYKKPEPKLPEVTLQGKGKIIISKHLQDQIDYLHRKVGSIEWCGILFFRKIEGEINNPESLVFEANDIYPMNIGSETFTSSEIEAEDVVNMYELIPDAYESRQGLIHTHHTMATFFSGTDMSELHDNAPLHNYYLSLIVNFDGKYSARIAYIGTIKNLNTFTFKDSTDVEQSVETETEKKVLVMVDLDIEKAAFQEVVPEYFQARYEALEQQHKESKTKSYQSYRYSPQAYTPFGGSFGTEDDWEEIGSNSQIELFREGMEEGEREKKETQNSKISRSYPESKAIQKAKEIQKKQVGSGKLVNEQNKYISVGDFELRELVLTWLNAGLDVDSEMLPPSKFNSIAEGLKFFDEYFEKNPAGLDYFLTSMSKYALTVFRDYSLLLIQKKGTSLLQNWVDTFSIAGDLYNILETINQFANQYNKIINSLD